MLTRLLIPLSKLDDARLVARAGAGDAAAFAALYDRHHASLLAFCRHMLGNRADGEDALQQTFIRAHGAMLRGQRPDEPRAWLFAIARNRCRTMLAARRDTLGDGALELEGVSVDGLTTEAQQRAEVRELLADMSKLPEDQRAALLLTELRGFTHEQIAHVIGCPAQKVKALVFQARSHLLAEREARDTACVEIRQRLEVARGGELRRGVLRRHLRRCDPCRAYSVAVAGQRSEIAGLMVVVPSAGLKLSVLGAVGLAGAGADGVAGGAGAAAGAAAGGGASGGGGAASGGGAAGGGAAGGGAATGGAAGGGAAGGGAAGGGAAGGGAAGGGAATGFGGVSAGTAGAVATKVAVVKVAAVLAAAGAVTGGAAATVERVGRDGERTVAERREAAADPATRLRSTGAVVPVAQTAAAGTASPRAGRRSGARRRVLIGTRARTRARIRRRGARRARVRRLALRTAAANGAGTAAPATRTGRAGRATAGSGAAGRGPAGRRPGGARQRAGTAAPGATTAPPPAGAAAPGPGAAPPGTRTVVPGGRAPAGAAGPRAPAAGGRAGPGANRRVPGRSRVGPATP